MTGRTLLSLSAVVALRESHDGRFCGRGGELVPRWCVRRAGNGLRGVWVHMGRYAMLAALGVQQAA